MIVVPSLDLVVVRMGHLLGGGPGQQALNRSLGELRKLLEGAEAQTRSETGPETRPTPRKPRPPEADGA